MRAGDDVAFLQWALPRLHLRWEGFRRVRGQVCKRIARRIDELALPGFAAYRAYLEQHAGEWARLDELCRVTISRFYRDHAVFAQLEHLVLPELATRAAARGVLRCWSAGCASGEEPYTLAIVWRLRVAPAFPALRLHVLATDADAHLLERARRGCYDPGTLKELPAELREAAFDATGDELCVRASFRDDVELVQHDLRAPAPAGPFDLVLCRNVAFTYFDDALQRERLAHLADRIVPGGALVIGGHERLPQGVLAPWLPSIFRKP
ncbi:MAG TPA: CheR family methyltransferase [Kofleriaceae bacterium]|jgi:chemotaxis protein methyltransferase CheR|nr:CheR family methyltransferase [Kofleriaceae bacterium]